MNKILAVALFSLISLSSFAIDFKTDQLHSKYRFTITHLAITEVEGQFNTHKAFWSLNDEGKLESFEAEVDTASIDTDNKKRDNHLRNGDFFAAKKFPKITFKMEKHEGNKVTGQMTMRGVTKQVTFDAKISKVIKNPFNGNPKSKKVGVKLTTTINRKDFSVGNGYKTLTLSDEVLITISLQGDSYEKK